MATHRDFGPRTEGSEVAKAFADHIKGKNSKYAPEASLSGNSFTERGS